MMANYNIHAPHEYPRRLLLLVTGLSPQVVTETLYALTQVKKPAFVPTRIVVITTAEGARRIDLELLNGDKPWFYRLCKDYELGGIEFNMDQVHIIHDEQGRPIDDIRTPEQNSQVADQIIEMVRELAADPKTAIHASIAGGRKTMGFYLGYAMSLYGRPQDRLSHVLVDEGFENNPDFFYPARQARTVYTAQGKPLDASKARVMLANIPFVRLRDGLPDKLLKGKSGFSETVALAQKLRGPVSLKMDLHKRQIQCAGVTVEMTTAEMAFYLFMAQRALSGQGPVRWGDAGWKDDFLRAYRRLVSPFSIDYERAETALQGDEEDEKNYFESRKSRTNSALKKQLGLKGSEPYQIQTLGPRGRSRYGLTIAAKHIKIIKTKSARRSVHQKE